MNEYIIEVLSKLERERKCKGEEKVWKQWNNNNNRGGLILHPTTVNIVIFVFILHDQSPLLVLDIVWTH